MIEKLQSSFQDILYSDLKHQYFCKGKELTSVTKYLNSLKPKFNSGFWSVLKAYEFSGLNVKSVWGNFNSFRLIKEDGTEEMVLVDYDDHTHLTVSPEEVRQQWAQDSNIGTTRGTYLHDYLDS